MTEKKALCPICKASTGFSLLALSLVFAFMFGCREKTGYEESYPGVTGMNMDEAVFVETHVLDECRFFKEIQSNGRLRAKRKQELTASLGVVLTNIKVRNGERVVEGQTLATLCSDLPAGELERARLQLMRASLDMEDILLGMGYGMRDSLTIPAFTWQMAGVRSGYFEVLKDIRAIENEMKKTTITAPFNGVAADVKALVNQLVNPGDVLLTLIDKSAFIVSFPLMEQEIETLEVDMPAEVIPFSQPGKKYAGYVHSINPVVDDHGQVEVTAIVKGAPGLIEGMHVRVNVQVKIPGQMVVPRSAVLLRDGKDVLFKYLHGKAIWTYVNVLHKNSKQYSVIADPDREGSLAPGDTIIVSGNLHLAHGTQVKRNSR